MDLRGRCGARPLSPELPGVEKDDSGGTFIRGRTIVRGSGPDTHGARLYRCPRAMTAAAGPVIEIYRHHAEGVRPLGPDAAAPLVEAVILAERVHDRVKDLHRREAG